MYWSGASLAREMLAELPADDAWRTELTRRILPYVAHLARLVCIASGLRDYERAADFANMVVGILKYFELGLACRANLYGPGSQVHQAHFPGIASPLADEAMRQLDPKGWERIVDQTEAGWRLAAKPGQEEAQESLDALSDAVRAFSEAHAASGDGAGGTGARQVTESCAPSSEKTPSATFKRFAESLGLDLAGGLELELRASNE